MKLKFKAVAKDETSVTIEVKIETPKYVLTRGEAKAFKERLKNRVHAMLRETNYDVGQISISR